MDIHRKSWPVNLRLIPVPLPSGSVVRGYPPLPIKIVLNDSLRPFHEPEALQNCDIQVQGRWLDDLAATKDAICLRY